MSFMRAKLIQLVFILLMFAGLAAKPIPASADFDLTLGCSATPSQDSLCIHVLETGLIQIHRYVSGYWNIATWDNPSALQVNGVGYNLGNGSEPFPTRVSNTRSGNTITTILNAGTTVYTQTVSYTDGDEWIGYTWSVKNQDSNAASLKFVHMSTGSNTGSRTEFEPTWNGSDTVGVNSYPSDAYWENGLQGVTVPSAYASGRRLEVSQHVSTFDLANTLIPQVSNPAYFYDYDYAYALQWNQPALAAGETWQISAREHFVRNPPMPKLSIYKSAVEYQADLHSKVTSSPAGIDCRQAGDPVQICSARFAQGTKVELTAYADPGYTFLGWYSNGASIITANPFPVVMDADQSITASFGRAPVNLTVTVTDGGGHLGMPLSGSVLAALSSGNSTSYPIDPFTGQVVLPLYQALDYTLQVISEGYISQERQVNYTTSNASESFSLLPDPASGCPVGYQYNQIQPPITTYTEGFENSTNLPAGWTQWIGNDPNPGWVISTDAHTGSASLFHDHLSPYDYYFYDTIYSAPFLVPAGGQISFYQKTDSLANYGGHHVYLFDETNQQSFPLGSLYPPAQENTWQKVTYSLAAYAGKNVSINFFYIGESYGAEGDGGDQWYLDDIQVTSTQGTCQTIGGGRIAGYVTDVQSNQPIISAVVTSGASTNQTKWKGLYVIWAPAGNAQVQAGELRHFSQSKIVAVTEGAVTHQDFALELGYNITASVSGTGTGTVTRDADPLYHKGDVIHLTAQPGSNTHFTSWSGDGINEDNRSSNPLTLTVTGDMSISAAFAWDTVDVTVTLTDGGAHAGMPLGGTVTSRLPQTYWSIDTPYTTNLATGQVTLHLDQTRTYTLIASAPGYATQRKTVSYLSATAAESFALQPDAAAGCPSGYQLNPTPGTYTLLNEGFESGTMPPTGWSQNQGWLASDSAYAGAYSAFHDLNKSDNDGDFLITPRLHIPANATLSFSQKYNLRDDHYGGGHYLYVSDDPDLWFGDYSSLNEIANPAAPNTWEVVNYDLSAYAGRDLYIFFNYAAWSGDYYTSDEWYVDNVKIEGTQGSCTSLSGGRVAGVVTDTLDAHPLSGAIVTSGSSTATTGSDGSYAFWFPLGSVQLTVSAAQHVGQTRSVTISDTFTRQDFTLTPGAAAAYTLTITPGGEGSGSVSLDKTGPYSPGTLVELTAVPNAGSRFTGWSGDGIDPAHASDNPVTVTVTKEMVVSPLFALIDYQLTLNAIGNGWVINTLEKPSYHLGDRVYLIPMSGQDSHFVRWSGDGITAENSTQYSLDLKITGNMVITARFELDTHILTTHLIGSGTIETRVNGQINTGPYPYDGQVELTAVPAEGWRFVRWDDGSTAPQRTIQIKDNMDVIAEFVQGEYTLEVTVADGLGGSVTRSKPGPYHLNDVITLTAVADPLYHFKSWAGATTGASPTAQVTITGNLQITAQFSPYQADLGITVTASDAASPDFTLTVTNHGPDAADDANFTVSFTAEPETVTWTCTAANGAACSNASGAGNLAETITTLPAGGSLAYTIHATLGQSASADISLTAPEVDPITQNNHAEVVVERYKLVYLPIVIR